MKIMLFISFFLTSIYGKSQNLINSIETGSKYSNKEITQAINNSNLCGYVLDIGNRMLSFDDGSTVSLKSKDQLSEEGITSFNTCNYHRTVTGKQVFSISQSGLIIIKVEPINKNKSSNL